MKHNTLPLFFLALLLPVTLVTASPIDESIDDSLDDKGVTLVARDIAKGEPTMTFNNEVTLVARGNAEDDAPTVDATKLPSYYPTAYTTGPDFWPFPWP